MQQDEQALVQQAYEAARTELQRTGRVLPAAYMLVHRNPQTSAKLTHPTAIGAQAEEPFASRADYEEFLDLLRQEAKRLEATAVAFCAQAEAEIEEHGQVSRKRVVAIRIEDQEGIGHVHAVIEGDALSGPRLGTLVASHALVDDAIEPILLAHAQS